MKMMKIDLNKKLTNDFTLGEFIKSDTAEKRNIDNTPSEEILKEIDQVAKLMQTIRDYWQSPIIVTSGYRCKALNTAVNGSKTSEHMYGRACDFKAKDKKDNYRLFALIKALIDRNKINVGQLIWEYGTKENPSWIHVSLEGKHKNKILYLY